MLVSCSSFFFHLLCHFSALVGVDAVTVQDDWVQPSLPDNHTSLYIGESFPIKWTAHLYTWFADYAPSANVTSVDLWVTSTDDAQYSELIQGQG